MENLSKRQMVTREGEKNKFIISVSASSDILNSMLIYLNYFINFLVYSMPAPHLAAKIAAYSKGKPEMTDKVAIAPTKTLNRIILTTRSS